MKQPTPDILILDIETSKDILGVYGLGERRHSPDDIIEDWFIICFCWKWYGGTKIYQSSVLDDKKRFEKNHFDDYVVIKRLHKLLQGVEIVVGHNVHKFDWKKFYARVIYHSLDPIAQPLFIDTLKEARNIAKFTANSMKYLAKYLKLKPKGSHSRDMAMRILKGDISAFKECIEYCKQDIIVSEDLYNRFRPYMLNHPNMNLWRADGIECCANCGETDFVKDGFKYSTTGKYQKYRCTSCGHLNTSTRRLKGAKIK